MYSCKVYFCPQSRSSLGRRWWPWAPRCASRAARRGRPSCRGCTTRRRCPPPGPRWSCAAWRARSAACTSAWRAAAAKRRRPPPSCAWQVRAAPPPALRCASPHPAGTVRCRRGSGPGGRVHRAGAARRRRVAALRRRRRASAAHSLAARRPASRPSIFFAKVLPRADRRELEALLSRRRGRAAQTCCRVSLAPVRFRPIGTCWT